MLDRDIKYKIREYTPTDEEFFDEVQFLMYKFEMWHDKIGSEQEMRTAYQEFILSDPLDHTGKDHAVFIVDSETK